MAPFNPQVIVDAFDFAVSTYQKYQVFISAGLCFAMFAMVAIGAGCAAYHYKENRTSILNR